MKKILLFLGALPGLGSASAQAYFQQEVNYAIEVELDDQRNMLRGQVEMEYHNHSPQTLDTLWMHLWPNAYSGRRTALARQLLRQGNRAIEDAQPEDLGYIDSLDFQIDGQAARWSQHPDHPDIAYLVPPSPIAPGAVVRIETPFRVKIPAASISRLGQAQQTFQITQWFPKPAVYDRDGWHVMPYLNQGEFYSEFGSFDVSITVPTDYVVAATGQLQTAEELAWLEGIAQRNAAGDSTAHLPSPFDGPTKTLRYTQDRVHDFAFFLDKNFTVAHSSVSLPHSGRVVSTWAFFPPEERLWNSATQYIDSAVYHYSRWNGDYLYDHCTAIYGALSAGAGMEYPMITIIGDASNARSLEQVIVHEVGHNWFYGMLAFNERLHPMLDEGINSFYEQRYFKEVFPQELISETANPGVARLLGIEQVPVDGTHLLTYYLSASYNTDQANDLHAEAFLPLNYGTIVYAKTAVAFNLLMNYLGPEVFDPIMLDFFDQWKLKHPTFDDLRAHFEQATDKDLDWFFDAMLQSEAKLDYQLCRLRDGEALVRNRGGVAAPFCLNALSQGQIVATRWHEGFDGKQWVALPDADFDRLDLGNDWVLPDFRSQGNSLRAQGLAKWLERPTLKLGAGLEKPGQSQTFVMPIAGYNTLNGAMVGLLLHNGLFPQPRLELQAAPMFALGGRHLESSDRLVGSARVAYHIRPADSWLGDLTLYAQGRRFGYLHNPLANLELARHYTVLNYGFSLRSKRRDALNPNQFFADAHLVSTADGHLSRDFGSAELAWANTNAKMPFRLSLRHERELDFGYDKTVALFEATIPYAKKKDIELRLLAGQADASPLGVPLLVGAYEAWADPLRRDLFVSRDYLADGFWNRQVAFYDGGMLALREQVETLVSVGFNMALPKIPLLRVYGQMASFQNDDVWETTQEFGLELRLLRGVASLYLPLYNGMNQELYDGYGQYLGFTLNLGTLNIFKQAEKVLEMTPPQ